METGKTYTLRDLRDELNKLSDEQLSQPARYSDGRSDSMVDIQGVGILQAEILCHNIDDEDYGDLETLLENHGHLFRREDYKVATLKGTVFIFG